MEAGSSCSGRERDVAARHALHLLPEDAWVRSAPPPGPVSSSSSPQQEDDAPLLLEHVALHEWFRRHLALRIWLVGEQGQPEVTRDGGKCAGLVQRELDLACPKGSPSGELTLKRFQRSKLKFKLDGRKLSSNNRLGDLGVRNSGRVHNAVPSLPGLEGILGQSVVCCRSIVAARETELGTSTNSPSHLARQRDSSERSLLTSGFKSANASGKVFCAPQTCRSALWQQSQAKVRRRRKRRKRRRSRHRTTSIFLSALLSLLPNLLPSSTMVPTRQTPSSILSSLPPTPHYLIFFSSPEERGRPYVPPLPPSS